MTVKYITSDVEFKKSTKIEGDLVTVKCTTRHPTGTIGNTWLIDFSDATQDEIISLATQSVVIKQQIAVRKCESKDLESFQELTIDVHEMVNRKTTRTPRVVSVDSVAKDAKKLTPEQLVETIAALQAKVDAEA